MTDQQGWPLPSIWKFQPNSGPATQHQQDQKEDLNLNGLHRLNIRYGNAPRRKFAGTTIWEEEKEEKEEEELRTELLTRVSVPLRVIGPPSRQRHGSSASQSFASGSVPDIPTPTHRSVKSVPYLASNLGFSAPQGNNSGGEDMYKDLLKRLNNMGIEVPGHTDKARNRAPGENSNVFSTPQSLRPAQPHPGLAYFAGSQGIDIENSIAAMINEDAGDNGMGYLPTPDDTPPHLVAGYPSQQQTTTLQSQYVNTGLLFPPAHQQQQHQHARNNSLAGPSTAALPPNCATAATFSPGSTFPHPTPTSADVPIPFKPMMMVQEMQNNRHQHHHQPSLDTFPLSNSTLLTTNLSHSPNFPAPAALAGSGCSDNYKGNHFLPSNRSANIHDKDNCSFFITGLPPGIDTHALLAHIRDVGRVFASYINDANPTAGHLTAAAKLVFFKKVAAQHFWSRHREQLPLMVAGYAAKVVRNRIKVAEPDWPESYTRVVVISGRKEVVQTATLLKIFEANFVFHIDEIIEDPLEVPEVDKEQGWILPEGWRTIEIRFGSWRSQAQTSFQVLGNHPDFRGVKIRYGRDPCDRIPDSERHLYRVLGGDIGGIIDRSFGSSGSEDQLGSLSEEDEEQDNGDGEVELTPEYIADLLREDMKLGSYVGSLATSPLLKFSGAKESPTSESSGKSSAKSANSGNSGVEESIGELLGMPFWRRASGPNLPAHHSNHDEGNDEHGEC